MDVNRLPHTIDNYLLAWGGHIIENIVQQEIMVD